MATTIKLKNSVVKDKVPLPSGLEIGELAVGAHSESPALFFKDNADNIIKLEPGSGVEPSPTPPVGPNEGDLWYDTAKNTLNYWDGASWVELGQAGDSPVTSVNGEVGVVVLDAADVGALAPGDNVSELANDAGYLTDADVGDFWELDGADSAIKNLDEITRVRVNGSVHTNANLDLNTGNFAIRLFPSSDQTGVYTAVGARNSYGTFSIGNAQVGVSNPWKLLVQFMVDANGKTIVGNDNDFGPPVAAVGAELTVKGKVSAASFDIEALPALPA
jgi:hypothetical protein